MRRPNGLLALMAGALLTTFLPLDDVAAQSHDAGTAERVNLQLTEDIFSAYQQAIEYRDGGECELFESKIEFLQTLTEDDGVIQAAASKGAFLSEAQRSGLTLLARGQLGQLKLDCPPTGHLVPTTTVFSFGGGASSVWAPPIPIGTERRGDEEFAITETDDQLSGGSFNVQVTAPLGRTYSGYINYQFTEADGSSSAHVPEGDRLVAITFPVPNPATDTTGIGPSPFGMNINTHTDFEMNDVQFGFGAPVDFFGASVATRVSVGGRYINVDRTDNIGQRLIQFPDIRQSLDIGQDSDLFGVQFGLDVENRPFQGSGFVYGASGSVSFLASQTDGNVRAFVDCPQCPLADDQNFTLRTSLDDGISSVALDAEAHVGYKFGEAVTINIFGSVTHFTDMPVVHLPISPLDDLRVDEDDLTNATVGVKVDVDLDVFSGTWLRFGG